MAYADFNYYTDVYYGAMISEAEFERLSKQASDYIDYMTRNKATADYEAVKLCCCALAEEFQSMEKYRAAQIDADADVASETVGGHSVTYRSASESINAIRQNMPFIVTRYLYNTGLLYRGGGRCVHSSFCDAL